MLVIIICCFNTKFAAAETSITVKEINYSNSTITLQVNNGDTKVYFSDLKKKTWQAVPGKISNSNTITMDISWITLSKNYVITFKANQSTGIVTVTIPKQVTNFKATYNKVKSTVTFGNSGTRTIEWRKKGSTIWKTVNSSTLSTELGYLCTNGATVYFRLAPVNGSSVSSVGYRASKEVSVVITKKASAPTITIDGSKFCIAAKKGMAYRTVNTDGTTSDWTTISSTSNLLLKNIAANVMYLNSSTTQSEVTLQFRTNATSSTQVSKSTSVTVPVQEAAPNEDTYGILLSFTSSTTLSLQVKSASSSVPFEYTIVDKDEELNYLTASWKTISSSTAINIEDDTAEEGSHIYVRKQSIGATGDDDFKLASVELDVTGSTGVVYPNAPAATSLSTLITTSGKCQTTDSASYLTFKLYSATSTTVSSINFLDAYGISQGDVTIKSTVAKNSSRTNSSDAYIITTKITSTSNIDSVTKKLLYAKITLANTDVISSTDVAGVRLYIYPATMVNNPSDTEDVNDEYTDSFSRVFMSNDSNDDTYFKYKLDLGTVNVPDSSTVDTFTSTAVTISSLKYDGYTLTSGTDFSVEYGTYVNDDDETVRTAIVTVNVSAFEKSSLIDVTNTKTPLMITLNNGEVMNDDIYITLVNTAIIKNTPIAWSMTEGSLKETKTTTITDSSGNTTSNIEEVISYSMTLTLFNSSYGVAVSDVTWGGVSVLGSTTISNGTATIYLSNAKLNKLTTSATDTKNIIITLSNGFVINTGCKLTVLNAS
ncbi:MAG: hypothetical protein PHF63_02445 [Herbinix sp.]|nr:hypothetical protein [Herbinix sp.]